MSKKELKVYNLAEVKKHTSQSDLWLILFNKVVNVTGYLAEHPGGMDILMNNAGTDATKKFVDRGHTDYARSIMEQYVIGKLDQESIDELEKLKAQDKTVNKEAENTVYKMDEVRKHNQRNDCWCVVDGRVVNVTYFLKDHPGGPDVLAKYAGKDATHAFNGQEAHFENQTAKKQLEEMTIGYLEGAKKGDSKGSSSSPGKKGDGKAITWLELSGHRTESDCWISVDGKVYDVTKFLDEHPGGGHIIVANSGRDATEEFNNQGHTKYAKDQMKNYYVGDIDKTSEKIEVGSQTTGLKPHQILFFVIGIGLGVVFYYLLR